MIGPTDVGYNVISVPRPCGVQFRQSLTQSVVSSSAGPSNVGTTGGTARQTDEEGNWVYSASSFGYLARQLADAAYYRECQSGSVPDTSQGQHETRQDKWRVIFIFD